jgi:hypothetical protein
MLKKAGVFLVSLCGFAMPAYAATIDGSQRLICSSIRTAECGLSGDCNIGLASDINVPQFFFDLANKKMEATRPDGSKLNSSFTMTANDNEPIVLQGAENGRGWSATINRDTGGIVISASGSGVAFAIFGACTQAG